MHFHLSNGKLVIEYFRRLIIGIHSFISHELLLFWIIMALKKDNRVSFGEECDLHVKRELLTFLLLTLTASRDKIIITVIIVNTGREFVSQSPCCVI